MSFHDDMSLGEARAALRELVEDGHRCPCCTQFAKVYRRPMSNVAARTLIALYRYGEPEYTHIPTLLQHRVASSAHQGGYATLSVHWGLIAEAAVDRTDGGRAGFWRLTEAGRGFVLRRTTVPKYARIYDGRCLGLGGPHVSIQEVLGQRFDYDDLMGRHAAGNGR